MRLRNQYRIVGMAWALLLGPGAALALFGAAAGIAWIWLFGDDPWPDAADWALPLIGAAGGLAAALACIVVADAFGRQREALNPDPRAERRRVLVLLAVPLGVILLVVGRAWIG